MLQDLVLSIKRYVFRANDPRAAAADAEYREVRPRVLESQGYRCYGCRLISRVTNEVHHLGKHDDNRPELLKCACVLCHAYNHVGESSKNGDVRAESLGKKTVMAYVPEISSVDLNNLQRVIGVAMLDDNERAIAEEIAGHIMKRASTVKEAWGSFYPSDFAVIMSHLSDEVYAERDERLTGLRLIFNFGFLKEYAARLLQERNWQALPVRTWSTLAEGHVGDSA
jgi:hypothetical protein